jgi:hypothetical protein
MSVKFHQKGKLKVRKWIDSGGLQVCKTEKKKLVKMARFLHLIFNVYPYTEGSLKI